MRTNDLIAEYPEQWRRATSRPFLDGVRVGSLPAAALDRWLAQDYLFVEQLLGVQARLLARAPRADRLVLAQGLVGLAEELVWFERLAIERRFGLAVPTLLANAAYCAYLDGLENASYTAAIMALWAVERAYLDSWLGARPGAAPYRALVEHWTTPSFVEYVAGLAAAAERALAAEPAGVAGVTESFLAVAEHERAFWEMVLAG